MNSFLEKQIDDIKKEVSRILLLEEKEISISTEDKDKEHDIAFCCASVAGKLKKSPVELAEKIISKFRKPDFIKKIEQKNIYVNFYFDRQKQAGLIVKETLKKQKKIKMKKTVLIEYPSVNPGKPLHIGHCRNAMLGASLSKIFEYCGTGVLKTDYIDDLGLQASCVTWGIMNVNKSELPKKEGYAVKTDQWQGRVYALVAKQMKEDERVEKSVRELMKEIEERKDKKLIARHDKFVEECLLAQCRTRWRMGIYHNIKIHESYLIDSNVYSTIFDILKKNKNIMQETEGKNKECWVAKLGNLEGYKNMTNPDKILVRSNGTSTYTAKDISLHFWKFSMSSVEIHYSKWIKQPNSEYIYTVDTTGLQNKAFTLKKEKVINVIGSEQIYTQKVMYDIIGMCGYEDIYKNSVHIAYEHVWFREKGDNFKFSGRSGNWIGYSTDEVLDRAVAIASKGVEERQKDKTKKWQENISESLGTSAVKFAMLKNSWTKKIAFDWDKIMDMRGDSACYLQYSYARAKGILRKADVNENDVSRELKTGVFGDEEYAILKKLSYLDIVVKKAKEEYSPGIVANYCLEIAGLFNTFYANNPVLIAEEEIKNARLLVVLAFSNTLKKALSLLLIDCAEEI